MQRAQLLRQLVLDSQYVIDEHLVATAMLARAAVRRAVGGVTFRNDEPRRSQLVASRASGERHTTSVRLGMA